MDKRIIEFLQKEQIMSLATCNENLPHCASVFYVFDEEIKLLAFASEKSTRHVLNATNNPSVAGTMLPSNVNVFKLKGLQFTARLIEPDETAKQRVKRMYYGRYPVALAMKADLWYLQLESIKFTDNTLGFGTKIQWNIKTLA